MKQAFPLTSGTQKLMLYVKSQLKRNEKGIH